MGFFSKVKTIFSGFFNSLFGQVVLDGAYRLIEQVGGMAADELTRKAKDRILRVEKEYPNTPEGNEKKRKEVLDYLADQATGLGLNVGVSVLNLLLEVSLAALKRQGRL